MENSKNLKFNVINREGETVECHALFTFDSEETGKSYIIYTDNSLDEDGSIRVFASVYKPGSNDTKLEPVETEREWNIIEVILSELQNEVTSRRNAENSGDEQEVEVPSSVGDNQGEADLPQQISIRILCSESAEEAREQIELLRRSCEREGDQEAYVLNLKQIGMLAYREGRYAVSETVFETLAETGNLDGRNNLAYMIRRKETTQPEKYNLSYAMQLLKNGVQNKEPFSLVNMALILSLRLGKEADWRLADLLIAQVPLDSVNSVLGWWEMVGRHNEGEGFLVHLWLLRHGKAQVSALGDQYSLYERIKKEIPQVPDWIKETI